MTEKDFINFWLETAENDYTNAIDSIAKKHYDWAFFQWHLAIEKLLKGLVNKAGNEIPFTHDLVKLSQLTKLTIPEEIITYFPEINTYNINARYDDIKRTFYNKVTQLSYYKIWHRHCQETFLWLKKQY